MIGRCKIILKIGIVFILFLLGSETFVSEPFARIVCTVFTRALGEHMLTSKVISVAYTIP